MGAPIPLRTPRLGLILDGDGAIDVQDTNWARVDQTAGVIYTKSTDGPLPNYVLYEGAIVGEKDTGISWQATTDGLGGWSKRYINYPFLYYANTTNSSGIPNNADTEWGWDTFQSGTNSTVANKTPSWNGCKVPVKGMYSIQITCRWNGGGGARRTQLKVNHVTDDNYQDTIRDSGSYIAANQVRAPRVLNKDDEITMTVFQLSGASLGFYSSVFVELINPLV